jgi:hypothetical protein
MVNIRLDEHWNLESDFRQWILSKDGRSMYYFAQLSSALESYFELKVRSCNTKTIHSLLDYHKNCLRNLKQLLAPFKIRFRTNIEEPKELRNKEGG